MGQALDESSEPAAGNETPRVAELEHASTEDLVGWVTYLAANQRTMQHVAGRITAELLRRRVLTIRELEDATHVPRSTLDRWAAPFKTAVAS